jgi:hypothetical protein
MNIKQVISDMKKVDQIPQRQTVLSHGMSVFKYASDLLNHLKFGTELKHEWKTPEWVYVNKETLLNNLVDYKTLKHYCIFHDLGKPYSKEFG